MNPGHSNRWISIKLIGVKSNRAAIGAKIKLTLAGAGSESAIRYREVSSGGALGKSPSSGPQAPTRCAQPLSVSE
jgi:hypothetical protein